MSVAFEDNFQTLFEISENCHCFKLCVSLKKIKMHILLIFLYIIFKKKKVLCTIKATVLNFYNKILG